MSLAAEELRSRALQLVQEVDPKIVDLQSFRGAQFDAGLAWVHFPVGFGGLGADRSQQVIVADVLRDSGATSLDVVVNPIGIGMAAPTLLSHGSPEMLEANLRRIFTGEDIWCQLFSEPTHGSDVAGISSRAVRDGDHWVVNGQKVWTTLAHIANRGLLLTRTNTDVPKHRGLSYFVVDMHAPGVEVRPVYQLTGEAEFNEVFLTDVQIPSADMLGSEGDGWRVATTTLMNERTTLGGGTRERGRGPIRHLLEVWQDVVVTLDQCRRAACRSEVVALWIRAEVARLTSQRAKTSARKGQPGPEGSIGKLVAAELSQDIYSMAVALLGPAGMLHEPGYPMCEGQTGFKVSVTSQFLRTRANTIEGGTSEIMRNIIGERVLGLAGDMRADRDIAWKDIPR